MIFPTPTYVGQPATYQGRTWFWNGTGWQVQSNAGQAVARFISVQPYIFDPCTFIPTPTFPGALRLVNYV